MSNLKNISGELLVIAYLPAEDRNQALETLNIIIGAYPDSDISREQKDLLQEIIEDLIKENTPIEGFSVKKVSKAKVVKKVAKEIEVIQPEIVKEEPKIETVEPKMSIEDIDDAF
jgi:hypothetical protein